MKIQTLADADAVAKEAARLIAVGVPVKIFMEPIAIIAALLLPARALSISAPGPY